LADHAGAPDRLSDLSAGMAERRLAAAALAQLHRRHAGPKLSARGKRAGRSRAVPDVARTRHADGVTRGAAVIINVTRAMPPRPCRPGCLIWCRRETAPPARLRAPDRADRHPAENWASPGA